MRTSRLALSTALGFILTVALTTPAFAAPAATGASQSNSASTPVDASAGGPIDLQIWPGQGGKTAIITVVEVDAKTKLPVTVRIPVTPGSTVEWVGEILGGPAESDIERPYKLVQGQGGQFAEVDADQVAPRAGRCDRVPPSGLQRPGLRLTRLRAVRQFPVDGDVGAAAVQHLKGQDQAEARR